MAAVDRAHHLVMSFDPIAEVYESLIPPAGRLERELPFLQEWIGAADTLLELACGTGAHAAALAAGCPGLRVTATDLAPAMIREAEARHGHDRVTYAVGDLGQPPTGPFQRALILGNSLNLLPDTEAVGGALRAIAQALAPQGRLLVQCTNPTAQIHAEATQRVRHGEDRSLFIKQAVPHAGRRFLVLSAAYPDEQGAWVTRSAVQILLDIAHDELLGLGRSAGLDCDGVWGDLQGGAWEASTSGDCVVSWTRRL